MRYSLIFGKTSKTAPADADSVNARLLTQAGFIAKQMAGVYNYLPLGLRVLNKIQNIVREEMLSAGANEVLMPALTSLESYKKTQRDDMDILLRTEIEGGAEAVLNPTHEEVVTPLVQNHTFSYRDLPVAVFQIQNKFRNEPRAKSGLLRGREFNMKDLYSFHANEDDLNDYYDRMIDVYFRVHRRCGLGDLTVLTYASGGVFSKYSHEFQTISDVGEDTIYLCEQCRVAVNKEIIEDQPNCPKCASPDLTVKKSIENGNIFKLRRRFSDAFGFTYKDETGQNQPVEMGCYGIGPSRLMGTIAEIFHDENGLMWPEAVAPFTVHMVALGADSAVVKEAERIYEQLKKNNVAVLFDDRLDVSAGEKFGDADLIGIPTRVVVSKKTLAQNSVEVKRRDEGSARLISLAEFLK